MECRYHLHPHVPWIHILSSCNRLVQPVRFILGDLLLDDLEFCVAALEWALATGRRPNIFNTDQGGQFTSGEFTGPPHCQLDPSQYGWTRASPRQVFIERLWRSVKYEEVYLKKDYSDVRTAAEGLKAYFEFYNNERPHQALGHETPASVYTNGRRAVRDLTNMKG